MKHRKTDGDQHTNSSPSPRKAWIETISAALSQRAIQSRLPPGRRGLKRRCCGLHAITYRSRLPPGRRGLKHGINLCKPAQMTGRLPPGRRGLKRERWDIARDALASPSPRKAWIETERCRCEQASDPSPSPRKAWIETSETVITNPRQKVAFPPEGVD